MKHRCTLWLFRLERAPGDRAKEVMETEPLALIVEWDEK
jgi:hypothetical protein